MFISNKIFSKVKSIKALFEERIALCMFTNEDDIFYGTFNFKYHTYIFVEAPRGITRVQQNGGVTDTLMNTILIHKFYSAKDLTKFIRKLIKEEEESYKFVLETDLLKVLEIYDSLEKRLEERE